MDNEVIFGYTQDRAEEKLYSIKLSEDEFITMRSKNVIKTNKRKITATVGLMSAKGYKCHMAYVDVKLPIWVLHEVIYGTIIREWGESYSNNDRIRFFGYE